VRPAAHRERQGQDDARTESRGGANAGLSWRDRRRRDDPRRM
jgi:hypothetical protein